MGKRAHKGLLARVDLPLPPGLVGSGAADSGMTSIRGEGSVTSASRLHLKILAVRNPVIACSRGRSVTPKRGPSLPHFTLVAIGVTAVGDRWSTEGVRTAVGRNRHKAVWGWCAHGLRRLSHQPADVGNFVKKVRAQKDHNHLLHRLVK